MKAEDMQNEVDLADYIFGLIKPMNATIESIKDYENLLKIKKNVDKKLKKTVWTF